MIKNFVECECRRYKIPCYSSKKLNAKFVYISTDYVFDGEGTHAFVETDAPNPVGYYGLTKHEGEK